MEKLERRAWAALLLTVAVMGLLVFLPAGTARYWQAWVFLSIFLAASTVITLDVARRDPALLERRMKGGPLAEKGRAQRIVMALASAGFAALLVVPGLDRRFGWSRAPIAVAIAGNALTLLGLYATSRVYRANTFAAATIRVEPGQRVISTGPYAIVRHPMYASALLYLVGMPLALGSYCGLLVVPAFTAVLVWRLLDEEKLLGRDLPGYRDYQAKVRWRLIPGVF
ncbi:MAG TPA: isoprenylcysteine carboxylmethyltransferase family protein [Thermoanaerobaculia bacterium]|nr:isoprenylcysteine carboxylmethyltransferase family protein [Thermoanaerobaculia bacterium]